MNRKASIRISAVILTLALCLSLPCLFLLFAQASEWGGLYGFSETGTIGSSGAFSSGIAMGNSGNSGPPAGGTENNLETGPEKPLSLGASGLLRSSRTVPGYNVFEVNNFTDLKKVLSTTQYPSAEYPETSVYILLTGNVDIETGFVLHSSIEKVVIDGEGQHTLSEIRDVRTQVSANTKEVMFKELTIFGYQYFGLLDNIHGTNVHYVYEQVEYTGPQILWAPNSTASFYDCNMYITQAGSPAHEVAEIRNVFLYGDNRFRHNSTISVFNLYYGGNLVLCEDATLQIQVSGDNLYLLHTGQAQSRLLLEDRASLSVEGRSSQLVGGLGLHSIYLGNSAAFHWKANRSGSDYISINADGGAKDAIYLSQGAEFCVAPSGAVSDRLIRISSGNVVVDTGAKLILQADNYTVVNTPFSLAGGSALSIGDSATMLLEIENRNNIYYGLITFEGTGRFTVNRDATVVIRGNRATGAVYFSGYNSAMEVTAPNYLEIATTGGNTFYFNNASALNPSTLTYTGVQQLNYWSTVGHTYLNGGRPIRRWVAQTEGLNINVNISGNGNGRLTAQLTGGLLDQDWTPALDSSNIGWADTRMVSAGRVDMEAEVNGDAFQGRITAPNMTGPYTQGIVQLRMGRPGTDRAISSLASATPEFHVTPNQTVNATDDILVWGEYGYLFHSSLPVPAGGTLALSAPAQMEFGTIPISFSDMEVNAQGTYELQVQDSRNAGSEWQVLASFGGFASDERQLDSTLVVNSFSLQETPCRIAAAIGDETVPLDASLRVPGSAAAVGTYRGNINWTLVDAP